MSNTDINRKIQFAQDFQSKWEYYFLSLTFTLLVVVMQTVGTKTIYKISTTYFQHIFICLEFPGWCCLIFSGLLGLYKLSLITKLLTYKITIQMDVPEEKSQAIKKKLQSIKRYDFWQRFIFVLAVIFILISRTLLLINWKIFF